MRIVWKPWMFAITSAVMIFVSSCSGSGAPVLPQAGTATPVPPPSPAFTPGPELPDAEEVAQAVADSVNVMTWPEEPLAGFYKFNKDACINGLDAPTRKIPCVHGDPLGTQSIVLYGDSHAGMWAPTLGVIAKEKGWRLEQLTLGFCPPADYPVYSPSLKRRYTECDDFRAQALKRIKELQPKVVFISAQGRQTFLERDGRPDEEGTPDAWAAGLAATITRLKENTDRVIVIGDIAYARQDPVDCLTANRDDVRRCNIPRAYAELVEHNQMEERVATENGALYIKTVDWLCTETVCPAVIAGMEVRSDRGHVKPKIGLWLRRVFAEAAGLAP